jgi:hypothetical protein
MPATASDMSIARFHRTVGQVNVALAVVCIATPAIRTLLGDGMALLLAASLLSGAALMSLVARCYDPRRRSAVVASNRPVWQVGARTVIATG